MTLLFKFQQGLQPVCVCVCVFISSLCMCVCVCVCVRGSLWRRGEGERKGNRKCKRKSQQGIHELKRIHIVINPYRCCRLCASSCARVAVSDNVWFSASYLAARRRICSSSCCSPCTCKSDASLNRVSLSAHEFSLARTCECKCVCVLILCVCASACMSADMDVYMHLAAILRAIRHATRTTT